MFKRLAIALACLPLIVGCASSPLRWSADTRELVLPGSAPALALPDGARVTALWSNAFLARLSDARLRVSADQYAFSRERAAQEIRQLVGDLDGKGAALTAPQAFSADYDEVYAEYALPSGASLVALHRTFGCGSLICHVTLVERDHPGGTRYEEVIAGLPHDERRRSSDRRWAMRARFRDFGRGVGGMAGGLALLVLFFLTL